MHSVGDQNSHCTDGIVSFSGNTP